MNKLIITLYKNLILTKIFSNRSELKKWILEILIYLNPESISYIFSGCKSLITINLTNFYILRVKDISDSSI